MRTWIRARQDLACGGCGARLAKGAPCVEVVIEKGVFSVKAKRLRCPTCAEMPVPADLPPLVEHDNTIRPMAHILTGVGALPLDFKARQMAREPGEEG